jgi:hypothetical protein
MNMSELKPCPCCGSENIEVKYIGNSHTKSRKVEIKCKSCRLTRADGAIYHDHEWCYETAKRFWNTRDSDNTITEQDKVIGELEEFVQQVSNAKVYKVEALSQYGGDNEMLCLCDSWKEKAKDLLAKHKQSKGE